jgi:hypothetical protein
MNDFEAAVERAAEATRDRETEQAHGGEGRQECEAEAYADTLGRLHAAYVFDGMVAMSARRYGRNPDLHVMPEYFNEHFGHRADIEFEPMPAQSCIRKSITHSGVKIFCLEDAVFKVVA